MFPVVVMSIFPGRPTVFKFYFTNSKRNDKDFSNFKDQGPPVTPSDVYAKEDNYVQTHTANHARPSIS